MTIRDWQSLPPDAAAHELHARVRTRLAPVQQRAAIALLLPEDALAAQFSSAQRNAPLGGVPFFAKDIFDVAGTPMFAGSTFLAEIRPAPNRDGAFVRALRDAGTVLVGKTHLHEFAYGLTGENPHYGDCEHPQFPGRTTGGSSSGSAAVVAAGIVPLALGSDTGGSVRVPAAFCGLFGFRLTPGDEWIRDAFPLAPSMDTAGWFTGNAGDMRIVLDALVGSRPLQHELHGCYLEAPGLDEGVAAACRVAAKRLAPAADSATREDLLHGFPGAVDAYNTLVATEACEVHQSWAEQYRARYDPAVWQRLTRAYSLTPAQLEAAALARNALQQLWTKFFQAYDCLVLPATPFSAPTKADSTSASRARLLALMAPASLGGLPVLTLPVLLPSGLTTGVQVVVNHPQSPAVHFALERWEEGPLNVCA
jgi:aspartyl-tRNA(Asn)/glutamyl-tRNA(Gln) amidotransferase subunit A